MNEIRSEGLKKLYSCRIAGTGSYLPERVVTNADWEKLIDTNDEWIVARTGIKERRFAADGQCTSDMGTAAAKKAIQRAGISPEEIDLIIVATVTPDHIFPSTAARIQHNLGAMRAAGFDLQAACAGFLYSMEVGSQFIATGHYKNILVVGAEKLTSITDMEDRNTCILFGDGAGAAILSRADLETKRFLSCILQMDGSKADLLQVPAGGSRTPASQETLDARLHYMKMQGKETFKCAVSSMVDCGRAALERAGCSIEDVKLAIFHQANLRIINAVGERLGLKEEQVFVNVNKYGNTSAASVAIALDEAIETGSVRSGDKLLLVAFGSGFTTAAIVLEW